MMMFEQFHFLRPAWFALLPMFVLLLWHLFRWRSTSGAWARVCDAELIPFVTRSATMGGARLSLLVTTVTGVVAITALAGPVWERLPVPVFRPETALVIALDLSASMDATDVAPSRLARAKYKIADILRARHGGQTALVVFAAQSFVVTPLTDDTNTLEAQLSALETSIMPRQGSEPVAALSQALALLQQTGMRHGDLLLVTDGIHAVALDRAVDFARSKDLHISILALGSKHGAPIPDREGGLLRDAGGAMVITRLESSRLQALANSAGGLYVEHTDGDDDVERLTAYFDRGARWGEEQTELAADQWHEFGPWLVLPLLPLAGLGFRRGVLSLVAAVLIGNTVPHNAVAGWWLTPDQAGQRAFHAQSYAAAAMLFENQEWRGAAQYRGGDYASAAKALAQVDSTRAHYNRGNALARLERFDEAIEAYGKALEMHPGHADAAYNMALVEELLQQLAPPDQDAGGGPIGDAQGAGERGAEGASAGGQAGQSSSDAGSLDNDSTMAEENESSGAEESDAGANPDAEMETSPVAGGNAPPLDNLDESALERAQATEQWLRQIPDDPAGLLRRKFQHQYKRAYGDQPYVGNAW